MKKFLFLLLLAVAGTLTAPAQSPVGRWKKISDVSVFQGQKMDSHAALLTQRPCAAKVVYEVNADGTFRLNAADSGCDESYKTIQQKLYSKNKWRVQAGKITLSTLPDFSVGQTYTLTFSGNTMIWTGTEGQGVITYRRL